MHSRSPFLILAFMMNAFFAQASHREQSWGTTKDGTPVKLYTLRNGNGMEAQISDFGATLVTLNVPDKEGKLVDVVLGFDDLISYESRNPMFGSTVGRFANRIAKGKFQLNGEDHQVSVNSGPNHLHGGFKGFDKKMWLARTIKRGHDDALELTYTSPDGEEGFPGTLQCKITYVLTQDNALEITFHATTDQTTIVNICNHSYFNLSGEGSGTALNHEMTLYADQYTPTHNNLIPDGRIVLIKETPLDFTASKTIGSRIKEDFEPLHVAKGYDHNYVINERNSEKLKTAARVSDPASGRVLTVQTTQPGIQFYTGNHLNGIVGKKKHRYATHDGFCLETQHFPDSPNHPNFPSVTLNPGDQYKEVCIYKFSTE